MNDWRNDFPPAHITWECHRLIWRHCCHPSFDRCHVEVNVTVLVGQCVTYVLQWSVTNWTAACCRRSLLAPGNWQREVRPATNCYQVHRQHHSHQSGRQGAAPMQHVWWQYCMVMVYTHWIVIAVSNFSTHHVLHLCVSRITPSTQCVLHPRCVMR